MNETLEKALKECGIELDGKTEELFLTYYKELLRENEVQNLTTITEWKDVCYKHFADSVLPHTLIKENASVIDIGTGAGFPSLPLKIVKPSVNLTMADSLLKRVNFLTNLTKTLELSNVSVLHSRAEDLPKSFREGFDVCVARAVAPLNTLLEYTLPFVKKGGIFLAYKSIEAENELKNAEKAISILGGKLKEIKTYYLNEKEFTRNILVIEKISTTPEKYPRGKNLPRSKPLC